MTIMVDLGPPSARHKTTREVAQIGLRAGYRRCDHAAIEWTRALAAAAGGGAMGLGAEGIVRV